MASRERASSVLNLQPGQTTFLPVKIPDVIRKMIPLSSKISRDSFRKVIQVVVKDIEGHTIPEEVFQKLQSSLSSLSEEKFIQLYAGTLLLMRYALRYPFGFLKKDPFCAELKELRLKPELIEDVCSIVFSERQQNIEKKQISQRLTLPSLESFRWRVDVTISTSVLNRVLEPTVLMEMKDSTGKITTFEASQTKFHELRYNVAYLLKEMEDLEKRSILKVQEKQ